MVIFKCHNNKDLFMGILLSLVRTLVHISHLMSWVIS